MNINLEKFFPDNFKMTYMHENENLIYIKIKSISKENICPCCGKKSNKVHSTYERNIKDLPIINKKLYITIISKKFFCTNADCERKIFSERFKDFVERYSRRSNRLNLAIEKIILTNNAETASKIIKSIITYISPSTILRFIRNKKINISSNYKIIGIDDWAFKKGHTYGTLICDLETNNPIDILKGRTSEVVEKWLEEHKTIEIVTRDRSSAYSSAINNVLPNSIQIADRFHLIKNLIDVIKEIIDSKYPNGFIVKNEFLEEIEYKKETNNKKISVAFNRKIELIKQVKSLYETGFNKSEIGRKISLDRRTVSKYINFKIIPNESPTHYKPSMVDEYMDIIKSYVGKGYFATTIYKCLKDIGFKGSYSTIKLTVKKIKNLCECKGKNKNSIKKISKQNLIKLLCQYYDNLTKNQKKLLKEILDNSEQLRELKSLIESFYLIFKEKDLKKFYLWINNSKASSFSKIHNFTNGLIKDINAVSNAIKYSFSNAVLEGNISRLKMIKRQMYGRANFDLIKQKVLYNIDG